MCFEYALPLSTLKHHIIQLFARFLWIYLNNDSNLML